MDIPEFKELFEHREVEWQQLVQSRADKLRFLRSFRYDFQSLLGNSRAGKPAHSRFAIEAGKDKRRDAETVKRLLDQAERLESPRKLRAARDVIGGILREHFKIEEVF